MKEPGPGPPVWCGREEEGGSRRWGWSPCSPWCTTWLWAEKDQEAEKSQKAEKSEEAEKSEVAEKSELAEKSQELEKSQEVEKSEVSEKSQGVKHFKSLGKIGNNSVYFFFSGIFWKLVEIFLKSFWFQVWILWT